MNPGKKDRIQHEELMKKSRTAHWRHCLSEFFVSALTSLRLVMLVIAMPIRFISLIVKERIHIRLDAPEVLQFFVQPGHFFTSFPLLAEQEIVFL